MIKKKKTSDQVKIAVIVSLIIGASIVAYGYLNYKTKMDTLDRDSSAKSERETKLRSCQLRAEMDSSSWWDNSCKTHGVNKTTAGCTLPSYLADDINARRDKDMENCVKLYSAN